MIDSFQRLGATDPILEIINNAPAHSNAETYARPPVAAQPAATAGGWPVVCASSFQGKPIPVRQWCVPDWVPDNVVTLLSGDGGTGKSLFSQQLATCCALGLNFQGIELNRRKVLYLAAEDDLDELHRRQSDINQGYEIDFSELDEQLWYRTLKGDEALLAATDGKGRTLKATATYENLKSFCVNQGIQLVIVDTVADTFGGLEIDRQHVTKYIRLLEIIARETSGAVIILAHPGVSGLANGTGISGSTAWRNAVRSVIYMRRPTEDEGAGPEARDLRIVERLKGNFAAAGAELRVSWWRGHFVQVGEPGHGDKAIDEIAAEVRLMHAIRKATSQGRLLSLAKTSPQYAPKVLLFYRETKGLRKDQIANLVERMLEKGELREAHVGKPSRYSTYIVPTDLPRVAGEINPIAGA